MKNTIHRKKLLNSKWTAVKPRHREKHFLVTKVLVDEAGHPDSIVLTAVHSGRDYPLDWRALEDTEYWRIGWQ